MNGLIRLKIFQSCVGLIFGCVGSDSNSLNLFSDIMCVRQPNECVSALEGEKESRAGRTELEKEKHIVQ